MKSPPLAIVLFVLSSISLLAQLPNPRDHHYDFAHRTLVKEMKDEEFLETLNKKKTVFLKSLWRTTGKNAADGNKVSSRGLDYKTFKGKDGESLVVIILPEAKEPGEASMVAAMFKEGELSGTIYTLEKGFEGTMLCGWSAGRHLNFGGGPENDVEKFREAIQKLAEKK